MRLSSLVGVREEIIGEPPRSPRELAFEGVLALAALTTWPILAQARQGTAEQRARAMLLIPLAALLPAVALALIDHLLTSVAPPPGRSATVIAISILAGGACYPSGIAHAIAQLRAGSRPSWTGLTEIGPVGALAALGFVAAEVYLLGTIVPPPQRASAIVLAVMLSRWAIVPIGYGLRPLERRGLGLQWEGGIKFREFAGSSALAMGIAMGLYQAVAIAAIVALALTILALRLLFSRRLGGVSGYALAAGAAVCELVILAFLALTGI